MESLRPPTITSPATHTMGSSLFEYLRIKVHPDVQSRTWSRIIIIGKHDRSSSSLASSSASISSPSASPARISSIEKRDKPFNWQRPTTRIQDSSTLIMMCFPGREYVWHYAAITATYLSLTSEERRGETDRIVGDVKEEGRVKSEPKTTQIEYYFPTHAECMEPLLNSNLLHMGHVDIVVMGYVHGLVEFTKEGEWQGGDDNELFAWKKRKLENGCTVAFLGCRVSFWADIAGNVVEVLQKQNGVKCVLYVGKLGSLKAEHVPNRTLATGNTSFISGTGEVVTWQNVLTSVLHLSPCVVQGAHYSSPSILDEDKAWLAANCDQYSFVDPEIGYMARAAKRGGIEFGYLHIISNNLAREYDADLSNERKQSVLEDRNMLIGEITKILKRFFVVWPVRTDL